MLQLDWFIVLVACIAGGLWEYRVGWGVLGVLAIAKLLKVL